ncbi:MAG: hypothetical protein HC873_18970, partial [Leptolyngbyaceae cyanobacterium SL_1_1]|nr:hypothetical protein [Leptolyngbyaceae cyanobacterium SL_1_1]
MGDAVWFCLQPKSQKDLYAAYKHQALLQAEGENASQLDYSEAGLRLSFAVEREVIRPFLLLCMSSYSPRVATETWHWFAAQAPEK